MEHLESYLAAEETELSSDLLDRIDEIVPPGHAINGQYPRALESDVCRSWRIMRSAGHLSP
jgi:hypothetical protein